MSVLSVCSGRFKMFLNWRDLRACRCELFMVLELLLGRVAADSIDTGPAVSPSSLVITILIPSRTQPLG
jgi:hypothetical protein